MEFSKAYLIGIGGIGMSALARYFKFKGLEVAGYDRSSSELTRALEGEGIAVHYEDRPELLPLPVGECLVVYTPAVSEDFGELAAARERGYKVVKRSRALGEIAKGQHCLAVAGTHGKTTVSTLTAHILTEGDKGCSAFLGGISRNYGTNLLLGKTDTVVVEADEFDRSFLQLHPDIAVVTAMDPDHLDIYGDEMHYRQAFLDFASQVSGTLIKKLGLPIGEGETPAEILSYSYDNPRADFYAKNPHPDGLGRYSFDLVYPEGIVTDIKVGIPGRLNAENAVAAAALCLVHGTEPEGIRPAIGSFQGVKRRLETHLNEPGLCYIDDYAHHPRELACAIRSIKEMFPSRELTAIFQPHLYSRTRDFAAEFAQSLSLVDKLILLDIYPAREEPIPGVSSKLIFDAVDCPDKVLLEKEELLDYLAGESVELLTTFGAGDIDRLVEPITQLLRKRI